MCRTDFAVPLQQIDKILLTAFSVVELHFNIQLKLFFGYLSSLIQALAISVNVVLSLFKKSALLRYAIYWCKAHNTNMQS